MKENSKCTASIFNKKVGGKWKLTIIYNLRNKDLRFGQLANLIEGISRKVLTDHLKQLEVDNLIKGNHLMNLHQELYTHLQSQQKLCKKYFIQLINGLLNLK